MPKARRASVLAVLMLTAVVTGGCEYLLYGTPMYPIPSYDPDASYDPGELSKPLATYASGTATIAIDGGAPLTLGTLTDGPHLFEYFGADLVWTNADGWYLRVTASEPGTIGSYASVTLDRVTDGRHWTVWDSYGRCKVDITSGPDSNGIEGTADCSKLRWSDAIGAPSLGSQPYIEGEPAFEAIMTFEASAATPTT